MIEHALSCTVTGTPATIRREKGHDIDAACGQLRLKTERATRETVATTTK